MNKNMFLNIFSIKKNLVYFIFFKLKDCSLIRKEILFIHYIINKIKSIIIPKIQYSIVFIELKINLFFNQKI